MLTSVILILSMLLLSAFFSGMEIAFTSKNRLKLEIDRKQSRMFDRIAEIFARHPGQYITTILVGNNIALVIYSLYMSVLLRTLFFALGWESIASQGSVAIETGVSTLIIIFVAEFLPKSVFRNNPNFYYRALAPVIFFFYLLLFPIARLTTLVSHGILRLFGRPVVRQSAQPTFSRDDLAALLDSNGSDPGPEPDNELKLFQNALDFADLRVRDCMVPRVDIEAVDADSTSVEQLTARFADTMYSRIFVWRGNIDNIIGYVNSKSLFTRPATIGEVIMEVSFVPETMPLQLVLQNFIKHRSNVAVVIDEFGGTAGIISLEDVRDRGRARRARSDREAGRSRRVRLLLQARGQVSQREVRSRYRGEQGVRYARRVHHLSLRGYPHRGRNAPRRRSPAADAPYHPFAHRVGPGEKIGLIRRFFRLIFLYLFVYFRKQQ